MSKTNLSLLAFCTIFISAIALGQDGPSLADIARQARAAKHKAASDKAASSAAPASTSAPAATSKSSPSPVTDSATPKPGGTPIINVKSGTPEGDLNSDSLKQYEDGIRRHFEKEEFALLDGLATEARRSKSRLPGGFWTIRNIYLPLMEPGHDIYKASDEQYEARIARLKRWIAQRPQSITARVALAGTYLNYAWKARGGGYADSVTEDGWRLFGERSALAGKILADAFELPEKCPEWYVQMMIVLTAQDGSIAMQKALFDKAVAFEPEYYYYYRHVADHLLPKWGGDEGDSAAFAAQAADRLGGSKGDIIYYEIASELNCDCSNENKLNGMSWDRIKKGYAALESQYGVSKLNLNKMALMASLAEDLEYAQQTFDKIGDGWDPETWQTHAHFDEMRDWVKGYARDQSIEVAIQQAEANLATPYGPGFDAMVAKSFSANYSAVVAECQKKSGDSFLVPFDVLLRLDKTGNVDQIYTTSRTNVTGCLLPELEKGKFPAPPQTAYWVKVSMQPAR